MARLSYLVGRPILNLIRVTSRDFGAVGHKPSQKGSTTLALSYIKMCTQIIFSLSIQQDVTP